MEIELRNSSLEADLKHFEVGKKGLLLNKGRRGYFGQEAVQLLK